MDLRNFFVIVIVIGYWRVRIILLYSFFFIMQSAKQKIIFGVDEVGRGCLAGPVMACAITGAINTKPEIQNLKQIQNFKFKIPNGLKDSKKINPKKREEIYQILKKDPLIEWGIGKVGEKTIDKINILQATKLAMKKAVLALEKKIGNKADLLLIDGNFGIDIDRVQKSIIKGDEKVFLISLASIVAKVERDRLMTKLHQQYPQYGFAVHKGYATSQHLAALATFGACDMHRFSFQPVCLQIKPKNKNGFADKNYYVQTMRTAKKQKKLKTATQKEKVISYSKTKKIFLIAS